MSDLSKLLYGAVAKFGTTAGITIGKVIDASGNFGTRNAPEFTDCDNDVATLAVGQYAYGALTLRAACYTTAAAAHQILRGATLAVGAETIGQILSVGGNVLTRNIVTVGDCDSYAQLHLAGGMRYGALNVTAVYDYLDDGDYDDLLAILTSASPASTVTLTLNDSMILSSTSAMITNVDLPGASGPEGRLEYSVTFQPVNGGSWTVTGASNYLSLLTKAIAADPTDDVELAFSSNSKLTASDAVITSLEAPTAGSPDDDVTFSVTLQPINGSAWTHVGYTV